MLIAGNRLISLDRRENAEINFISHAHSDHIAAAKSASNIMASKETIELIECAYGLDVSGRVNSFDVDISLLDSGHMLGAKQLLVDDNIEGNRILYSGDFQLHKAKTVPKIEIREADIIVIDSTYPDPLVKFDNREEVEWCIQKWVSDKLKRGIVMISAYAMGKAQELISILNDSGIIPIVSRKIGEVCEIYVSNGVRLSYISEQRLDSEESGEISRENFVYITNRREMRDIGISLNRVYRKRIFSAVATGFATYFSFDTDAQFPLSDHADFNQSTQYIDSVGARQILTYGKNSEIFASNLSSCGYNAIPFTRSDYSGIGVLR